MAESRAPKKLPRGMGSIEQHRAGFRVKARANGKAVTSPTFPDYDAAFAWAASLAASKVNGGGTKEEKRAARRIAPAALGTVTTLRGIFDDYLADMLARGGKPLTVHRLRSHVSTVAESWGDLTLDSIDSVALEGILDEMHAKGWKPSTINNRVNCITGAMRYAMRKGKVEARALVIKRPRIIRDDRPDPYTEEQVAKIIGAAEAMAADPDPEKAKLGKRKLAAVLLMARAGLRRSEAARFQTADLDTKRGILIVPVRDIDDSPKALRARRLPVPASVIRAVEALSPKSSTDRAIGEWTDPHGLSKWLLDVFVAAGIPRVQCHRLRHAWASRLANRCGATPWQLITWGGWAEMQTALRYYHEPEQIDRAAADRLDDDPKGIR